VPELSRIDAVATHPASHSPNDHPPPEKTARADEDVETGTLPDGDGVHPATTDAIERKAVMRFAKDTFDNLIILRMRRSPKTPGFPAAGFLQVGGALARHVGMVRPACRWRLLRTATGRG
jgi:hypothetical protein